jgi:hypothetical protein
MMMMHNSIPQFLLEISLIADKTDTNDKEKKKKKDKKVYGMIDFFIEQRTDGA